MKREPGNAMGGARSTRRPPDHPGWRQGGTGNARLAAPSRAAGLLRCGLLGLCLASGPAAAQEWERLWLNDDQLGAAKMRAGDHAAAARTFDDRRWRAAAWYRAGEYARAAKALQGLDDVESHYNRGNALARAGDLGGAVAAYETVLERQPGHADARHNLEVIRHLIRGGSSEPGSSRGEAQQQSGDGQEGGSGNPADAQTGDGQPAAGAEGRRADARDNAGRPGRAGESGRDAQGRAETRGDAGNAADAGSSGSLPEPSSGMVEDLPDPEQAARRASMEQWLRRVPDDPGGLLRRKFRYQYTRRGRDDAPEESW